MNIIIQYIIYTKIVAHAACAESLDCPNVSSSVRWTSQQVVERGQRARPVERKERTRRASKRSIYWHDCVGRRKHVSSRGTVGEVKEEGDRIEYTRKGEK